MSAVEVLSALTDVILQQQAAAGQAKHEPTPTEFFACISTTLGVGTAHSAENLIELLKILEAVTLQSSVGVVRAQCKHLASCLLRIASAANDNNRLLRLSLEALSSLMQVQDVSDGFWSAVQMLQCVNAMLTFLDDSRLKIRKTALDALMKLMAIHKRHNARAVRSYVADFCLEVMRTCTRSEYKRSLYVFLFLESASALLPEDYSVRIFEAGLRLQSCEQPVLTASVFRSADSFFQSPHLSLSTEQASQCVQILIDNRPQTADMESNSFRYSAIASGLVRLNKQDASAAAALLPRATSVLLEGCETDFTEVHIAVGASLKRMIGGCLSDAMIQTAFAEASAPRRGRGGGGCGGGGGQQQHALLLFISVIEGLFHMRYQKSWLHSLEVIKSLFERLRGEVGSFLLQQLVVKLAEVYQAVETSVISISPLVHTALADALGCAIRSCGVGNFLSTVPFRSFETPAFVGIDDNREWILSALHANLKLTACKLEDFATGILPIVNACRDAVLSPENYSLSHNQAQMIRTRILQLWSLFPDFCHFCPSDISASFPRLAAILEASLKDVDFPELHSHVVTGLTLLAERARERCPQTAHDSLDVTALKEHAHTFLPAILMFLEGITVSDSRFQEGVKCVAAWASIAPSPLVTAIAKKLLQLLLASTSTSSVVSATQDGGEAAAGWMAVVLAIIPHLPQAMIVVLYKTVKPLLSVNESVSSQKRAYGVLDALLEIHGEVLFRSESRSQILAVVSDSLLTCHVSARNMRLRCMETLMRTMEGEELQRALDSILGEVLICQKDANKKTRDGAIDLLTMMIKQTPPSEMLMRLCSAVVGETAVMRSSAVIGLCMLFLEWREDASATSSAAELLPTICLLLREECTEQTRAVLSFLRVCAAVFPLDTLHAALPLLCSAFLTQLGPFKQKFTSRIRAIMRKLNHRIGEEALRPLIPEEDLPLLEYIQRQARRSQRKKDTKESARKKLDDMLGSDSESEDEDAEDDIGVSAAAAASSSSSATREDYRISSRPKAIIVKDVQGAFPSSLADLLEDQVSVARWGSSVGGGGGGGGGGGKMSSGSSSSSSSSSGSRKRKATGGSSELPDDEDEAYRVVVTTDGKVVVQERPEQEAPASASAMDTAEGGKGGGFFNGKAVGGGSAGVSAGGEQNTKKKSRVKEPGEEYRSKKAGGDVWKKGMLEPHAYLPLDARLLNKKNHKEAVLHFGSVVSHKGSGGASGPHKLKQASHVIVGNRKQRQNKREKKAGAGNSKGGGGGK